jgi:hypothetical protein
MIKYLLLLPIAYLLYNNKNLDGMQATVILILLTTLMILYNVLTRTFDTYRYYLSIVEGKNENENENKTFLNKVNDVHFIGKQNGFDQILNPNSKSNVLTSDVPTNGAISIDLDKDGYMDLIVARNDGVMLYKNDKNGGFKKIKLTTRSASSILLSDENNLMHSTQNIQNIGNLKHLLLQNDGASVELSVTNKNCAEFGTLCSHLRLLSKNNVNIENFQMSNDYVINSISGPAKMVKDKIVNYIKVKLPKTDEFRDSKIKLYIRDKIFDVEGNDVEIDVGSEEIIDKVEINGLGKTIVVFPNTTNISLVVVPIDNINEKYESKKINVSRYDLGDRGGNDVIDGDDCINNLKYQTLNNKNNNYNMDVYDRPNMVNLTKLPNISNKYNASYSANLRGQNYMDVPVNNYKAPINIGDKNTVFSFQNCVNNLDYRTLNNKGIDYNMKKLQPDGTCGQIKTIDLLTAPLSKQELNNIRTMDDQNKIEPVDGKCRINLFKSPSNTNQYNVSYYSMNRKQ